ncbi:hypothetical protein HPP92_023112 [Vanilla planifolia]|uniref:Uncharacterized protein n=1 Tax=Vanilla planifolia TaxID=51239 RepID=A0A835UEG1_VANPL|nr:hypothetical protein HPP92_023112 [Vanilla planifolia]
MLREGLAKRRLLAELRLHLLLRRGKLAGKAIRGVLSELSHHQHHHTPSTSHGGGAASFSCRFMDPDASVYVPHEFLDSVADEESSAEVSPLPSVLATPVVPVKQLRVTDSPFVDEEETEADDAVDRRAEEFIRSFYDRRRQEMIGSDGAQPHQVSIQFQRKVKLQVEAMKNNIAQDVTTFFGFEEGIMPNPIHRLET